MNRYEVVESKVWRRDDGRTASPYGALPWETESEKARWHLATRGYTVRDNVSGTIGIGRVPWETLAEAQKWADKENARLAEIQGRSSSFESTMAEANRIASQRKRPKKPTAGKMRFGEEAAKRYAKTKKLSRLDELRASLPPGWTIETWSPGDGQTRYRFFENAPADQTYYGPRDGAYTALGMGEAQAFARGLGSR